MLLFVLLGACSVGAVAPDVAVVKDESFTEDLFVARSEQLYIAGQPNAADLEHFKSLGVTTVINLRHADEMDWNEAAAARAMGLTYFQVSVIADDKLEPSALDLIDELVASSGQETLLVHCRSGNRAAAWWGRHLVRVRDIQSDPALKLAVRAGLTYPPLLEEVKSLVR